jgi:hypothetical protein
MDIAPVCSADSSSTHLEEHDLFARHQLGDQVRLGLLEDESDTLVAVVPVVRRSHYGQSMVVQLVRLMVDDLLLVTAQPGIKVHSLTSVS